MHAFLDKYSVAMTALLLKDRWFNNGVKSLGFQKQIGETAVVLPEFESEGFYEALTHSAKLRAHILGRLG